MAASAASIVFGDLDLGNGVQYSDPFDGGNFTVTFAGGGNNGKYYTTGSGIRVYGGGTMTVAAKSGNVTRISIAFDGNFKPESKDVVNCGTYDPETGVWTGKFSSVTFTRPSGNGHWRIQSVDATVEAGTPINPGGDDPVVPEDALDNIAELTVNTNIDVTEYKVKLNDAIVTYVNGNYAYIQDASGAVVMYKNGHGLTAGDVLNGTATVSYQLRNGNPQITAIDGVTKTAGTAPEPAEVAASSWNTPINTVLSQYFKVTGATITKSGSKYYVELGSENVQLYGRGDANNFSVSDLSVTYTIIGFPTMYITSTATTPELQIFVQPEAEGSVKEEANLSFGESTIFTAVIGETTEFPELVNPHNLPVTWSSSKTDIATIDEATGAIDLLAAGQTIIKADFAGNDQYLAGNASYQLVVKELEIPGTEKFELVTDASSLADGDIIILAAVTDDGAYAMTTTQNSNNRAANAVAIEEDGTIIPSSAIQKITLEEGFYFNVGNGYLYAAGGEKSNSMKTEAEPDADGNALASIDIDAETGDAAIVFQGTSTRNYMRFNPNSGNPMFSCYAETSSVKTLPRIYRKVIDLNVTIGKAGWASVVTPAAVAMPEGVTGYIVTDAANGSAKLAEVSAVPANTPILVQGAAGTYTFNDATTTDAVTDNKLLASDGSIVGDAATIYVLSNEESHGVGFYLLASGTKVPVNKCYLQVRSGARSFIGFGDETAINSVKAEVQSSEVFDLQGRRVAQPTKGLYIMNEKKVMIK